MKYLKYLLVFVLSVVLIYVGFVIRNFPLIEWDKKIKIYEVFQVLSTIAIGIGIPFFVKKWIDDARVIRTLLNDESKDIINEANRIKAKIFECFENKSISSEDKQYLLYLFSNLEILIEVFERSIVASFDNKYDSEFSSLERAYQVYWRKITGGDLMADSFTKIDLDFIQIFTLEHNVFINSVRNFNIQIQK